MIFLILLRGRVVRGVIDLTEISGTQETRPSTLNDPHSAIPKEDTM